MAWVQQRLKVQGGGTVLLRLVLVRLLILLLLLFTETIPESSDVSSFFGAFVVAMENRRLESRSFSSCS